MGTRLNDFNFELFCLPVAPILGACIHLDVLCPDIFLWFM